MFGASFFFDALKNFSNLIDASKHVLQVIWCSGAKCSHVPRQLPAFCALTSLQGCALRCLRVLRFASALRQLRAHPFRSLLCSLCSRVLPFTFAISQRCASRDSFLFRSGSFGLLRDFTTVRFARLFFFSLRASLLSAGGKSLRAPQAKKLCASCPSLRSALRAQFFYLLRASCHAPYALRGCRANSHYIPFVPHFIPSALTAKKGAT
jgi:hypothetical protein